MNRNRRSRPKKDTSPQRGDLVAEAARLTRELEECRARLRQIERQGIDRVTAQRLAALEEGQRVARGQAVDAALARSKAEAELRSLQRAIAEAPGLSGWVVRRAVRRLSLRGA